MKVCSNCKGIVTDSTNFCPNCGGTDFTPARVLNADDASINCSVRKNQEAIKDRNIIAIIGFVLSLVPLFYPILPHFTLSLAGFIGFILSTIGVVNSYDRDLPYRGLAIAGVFVGFIGLILFVGGFVTLVMDLG